MAISQSIKGVNRSLQNTKAIQIHNFYWQKLVLQWMDLKHNISNTLSQFLKKHFNQQMLIHPVIMNDIPCLLCIVHERKKKYVHNFYHCNFEPLHKWCLMTPKVGYNNICKSDEKWKSTTERELQHLCKSAVPSKHLSVLRMPAKTN